jgi:hypothetical protein
VEGPFRTDPGVSGQAPGKVQGSPKMGEKTSKPLTIQKPLPLPEAPGGPVWGPRTGPSRGAHGLVLTPPTGAGAPPPWPLRRCGCGRRPAVQHQAPGVGGLLQFRPASRRLGRTDSLTSAYATRPGPQLSGATVSCTWSGRRDSNPRLGRTRAGGGLVARASAMAAIITGSRDRRGRRCAGDARISAAAVARIAGASTTLRTVW